MRNTDIAWAAGIMDGEGTVRINRVAAGINRRINAAYQLYVTVNMVDKEAILKLQTIFGGSVTLQKSRNTERHNPTWKWLISDESAVKVLREMQPYLVTKRSRAILGIEFREACKMPVGTSLVPDHIVALRQNYYERMKELNRRGPLNG